MGSAPSTSNSVNFGYVEPVSYEAKNQQQGVESTGKGTTVTVVNGTGENEFPEENTKVSHGTDDSQLSSQENFKAFCEESFAIIRKLANILDANAFSFTDLQRLDRIFKGLIHTHQLYFEPEKMFQREEYELFQIKLCDVMLETNQLPLYEKIIKEVPKSKDFIDADDNHKMVLAVVMGTLHNCTDMSDSFAEAVTNSAIIGYAKEILDVNVTEHLANNLKSHTQQIILNCHGILHNTSMRSTNIEGLRKHDIVTTLKPYLESPGPMTRISTLASLANIVTEEECDIIGAHKVVVDQLLTVLQNGTKDKSRRCNGWSCKECVLAVRQLARNDANKKLLVELNTLSILVTVATTGDLEEQRESIHAILQLSFDEEARKQIVHEKDLKVMDLLLKCRESNDKAIADLCLKTFWNLRDELKESKVKLYRETAEELFGTTKSDKNNNNNKQHIMISYQSANRDLLVKIKERLRDKGHKVWMDVEQMSGDILETMAQGVENAAVVLVCFSRKYKESDYCRQEAQYAHKLKKAMIPLKMEEGYEPDGWLGFMLASEYFVNFSGKYIADSNREEEKVQDLFRQIEKKWKSGLDFVDAAIIQKKDAPVVSKVKEELYASHGAMLTSKPSEERKQQRPPKFSAIRRWSKDDVHNWLKNNNLENTGFDKITGAEISLLARMLLEAPDQLYKCLRHDLNIKTLVAKANFVWALEELIDANENM